LVKQSPSQALRLDQGTVRVAHLNVAARGRPIVFLHEALGSIALWRGFPADLCNLTQRPGLVYERIGHGQSDPLQAKRQIDYLQDEAAALLAGAKAPQRFGAIVTMAAHVLVETATLDGIRAAASAYRDTDLRQRLARYHGTNTDALFAAWAETWLSAPFADWNIEADLKPVAARVLALQGENDEYGTLDQLARIGRAVGGACETWAVPGAAHQPHLQAREAVLARVASFLAEA
jgi:pimeloyl-ACP methyl ester carboxylesterase